MDLRSLYIPNRCYFEWILQRKGHGRVSRLAQAAVRRAFLHSAMSKLAAPLVDRFPSLRMLSVLGLLLTLSLLVFSACSGGDEVEPPTQAPPPTAAPAPTPQPAAPTQVPEPTAVPTATSQPAMSESASSGVVVSVSDGSVARYSVTEQLARLSSPIDAVGETGDVEGTIVFDSDGSVDPARSVITVVLAGLTSDESRRDRYVSGRVFDTSQYPNAELVITGAEGLDWPFPDSGETTFQIDGDMTIAGSWRPR